jgi:TDG/mug DNA glycosylase family protein
MISELAIPNLLANNLKILFIGINPGLRSAAIKHHFASHSTRFWKLLADSGITPKRLHAEEDTLLLTYEYGITNIVPRTSASAAQLSREEFIAGSKVLMELLHLYKPQIAAYLGKDTYRYMIQGNTFDWGRQQQNIMEHIIDFVLPNPSGLNRMPYQVQLHWYCELKKELDIL